MRFARRPALWQLGIASRLAIAFAGVAVLAAAANLIVDRGVAVVESSRHVQQAVASAGAVPANSPQPAASQQSMAVDAERASKFNWLSAALDRYGRAVQEHAEIDSAATAARYAKARTDLDSATVAFTALAQPEAIQSFSEYVEGILRFKSEGSELLKLTKQGRLLRVEYRTTFERMSGRSKHSLESSWKILGRVVARQSLLQVRGNLDEIRDSFSVGATAGGAQGPLVAVEAKEAALDKTLRDNESGLRRSQGDPWYQAMREDLAALVALRSSISQKDDRSRMASDAFSLRTASIVARIPKDIAPGPAASAAPPAGQLVAASAVEIQVKPEPSSLDWKPASRSPPIGGTSTEQSSRVLVAWISFGVLALMFYVSMGTVLSISRPVRGLLNATAKIAAGDSGARVARGGIRELDTLAVAFNEMAEQLSAAHAATRDSQQRLEDKVEERTRQLQELAEHDHLTGLPNRRHLFILLNAAIAQARSRNGIVGVYFLDIDNFKNINDSIGHAFGDRVLLGIAKRLQATARDFGFAARLGGDEFTIVHAHAQNLEEVRLAGLEIVRAFEAPIEIDGRELSISVSVGASVYPDHEQDAEALLRAADAALFRAKALGRSQLAMFTPDLLSAAASKFALEQGLRKAIVRGEFELVFQPEISVATLDTKLVEALIRWRKPDGHYASPGEFLAVAEESGLIMEISDWVLCSAIEAAAYWHHGAWPEARVAINVSPRQLLDYRFVDRVQELLKKHDLPIRCIEIELTESVLQTGPATIETLKRLRTLGMAIALDDFGTGYSSLASLEQLPLTRIKLDRSLIAAIDTNARSATIAKAIIALCQGLGLEVTAEGVERPEQFALLLDHQGTYLQGYLLARPVSRDDLIPLMRRVVQVSQELVLLSRTNSKAQAIAPGLVLSQQLGGTSRSTVPTAASGTRT